MEERDGEKRGYEPENYSELVENWSNTRLDILGCDYKWIYVIFQSNSVVISAMTVFEQAFKSPIILIGGVRTSINMLFPGRVDIKIKILKISNGRNWTSLRYVSKGCTHWFEQNNIKIG
jgi:hypothetical protein